MNYMRINPDPTLLVKNQDDQEKKAAIHVEVSQEGPGLLPDFKGRSMRDVLKRARSLGLEVIPDGTGLAFTQQPAPGIPLDKITQVRVSFRPPS